MHIEPGVVVGVKLALSYVTAAGSAGILVKSSIDAIKKTGLSSFVLRSALAVPLVFIFFQVLPHFPVGVSEVHFIFGATLFLAIGLAPTAIGMVGGLLLQGLLFSPPDLPQFGMNITTLLVPLFGLQMLVGKIIPENLSYTESKYSQIVQLSLIYQGGIVSWVAFWVFHGQGFGDETMASVGSFGLAYLSVIIIEPLVSIAALAGAKNLHQMGLLRKPELILNQRLFQAA